MDHGTLNNTQSKNPLPYSGEGPRPPWLRVKAPTGPNYTHLSRLIKTRRLNTVCSSASCPNIGECWEMGVATFMILGRVCTRACRFCDVDSSSRPSPVDLDEPKRLAETIRQMDLKHAVITSVTRDDLPDGGVTHFVNCLREIRAVCPAITLEILTPDFKLHLPSIDRVIAAKPEVFNHNLETTRELTPKIRSGAQYDRSLKLLKYIKEKSPETKTKSGIMLGLGESLEQVKQALRDLRESRVDSITIGQYLRPSPFHHEVMRYANLEEFKELKDYGDSLGFWRVESGPLVRSSYHARLE